MTSADPDDGTPNTPPRGPTEPADPTDPLDVVPPPEPPVAADPPVPAQPGPGLTWRPPPADLPPPDASALRPPFPPPPIPAGRVPFAPPRPLDVPATLERLRTAQRGYSAALLGAVVVQLADLPWSLLSGVLAALGIAFGVRALYFAGQLRQAGARTRGRGAVIFGIGLATLLVLQASGRVLLLDAEWDHQRCRAAAQTHAAQKVCDDEHQRRLRR